jgi:hypothetical protein
MSKSAPSTMPEHDIVTPKRTTSKRCLALVCAGLLLLGGLGLALTLARVAIAAAAVQDDLAAIEALAESDVQTLDIEAAMEQLHTTRADVQTLHDAARPFLWLSPHLGWVTRYGPDIQAAPALLEMAVDLSTAAEQAVEPLAPLLAEEADQDTIVEAVTTLDAARPQLTSALNAVRAAQETRRGLDVETVSPRLRGWMAKLDRYLPLMEQGVQGALLLPELLGADAPATYLVLVQNEDELRPTGGFISGVARVTIVKGSLHEIAFEDSYAVDDFSQPYPDPPAPLLEYMLSELWLFRDSNWSPDFPTSAQAAISLYTLTHDVQIDGVVAVDQQAVQELVGALEPLHVPGYAEPVTRENAIAMAHQSWTPDPERSADWWAHRKDFMAALLDAIVARLEGGLDRPAIVRLARAALVALEEKHLLIYLKDQEAAALLADMNWDGALTTTPGDYLMVVDANLGFNKANAVVQESLEYLVDLTEPTHPQGLLTVHHWHPLDHGENPCRHEPRYDATYEQMAARCYWDYLRVYVPRGVQLLDATAHPVPGSALLSGRPSDGQVTLGQGERNHDVLSTFLLLRPHQALQTRFAYALPPQVVQARGGSHEYSLVVQKQPGTLAVPLRVRIMLPPRAKLMTSDPAPTANDGAEVTYALALKTDRALKLTFGPGEADEP